MASCTKPQLIFRAPLHLVDAPSRLNLKFRHKSPFIDSAGPLSDAQKNPLYSLGGIEYNPYCGISKVLRIMQLWLTWLVHHNWHHFLVTLKIAHS